MLKFKVMAGQMLCGYLTVLPSLSHHFTDRDYNLVSSRSAIDKVASYKHLKLIRI